MCKFGSMWCVSVGWDSLWDDAFLRCVFIIRSILCLCMDCVQHAFALFCCVLQKLGADHCLLLVTGGG